MVRVGPFQGFALAVWPTLKIPMLRIEADGFQLIGRLLSNEYRKSRPIAFIAITAPHNTTAGQHIDIEEYPLFHTVHTDVLSSRGVQKQHEVRRYLLFQRPTTKNMCSVCFATINQSTESSVTPLTTYHGKKMQSLIRHKVSTIPIRVVRGRWPTCASFMLLANRDVRCIYVASNPCGVHITVGLSDCSVLVHKNKCSTFNNASEIHYMPYS